jgi:signal transduction histidine kinase
LMSFALWVLVVGIVGVFGQRSFKTSQRLARMSEQAATEATQVLYAERLRLARELHDIVSHSVSIMLLHAAGARKLLPGEPDRVDDALQVIEQAGVQATAEMRRLLGALRATDPDAQDGNPQYGFDYINELVETARVAGLKVKMSATGHPAQLDPSVGLAAYRVVQEALTNTRKHAGPGAFVSMAFTWGPNALTLEIRDRPRGSELKLPTPSISTGNGLIGLRERVTLVGGDLLTEKTETGFLIRARFPVRRG